MLILKDFSFFFVYVSVCAGRDIYISLSVYMYEWAHLCMSMWYTWVCVFGICVGGLCECVYTCVCVVYVSACVYKCMHKRVCVWCMELTNLARLAGQEVHEVCFPSLPLCWGYRDQWLFLAVFCSLVRDQTSTLMLARQTCYELRQCLSFFPPKY